MKIQRALPKTDVSDVSDDEEEDEWVEERRPRRRKTIAGRQTGRQSDAPTRRELALMLENAKLKAKVETLLHMLNLTEGGGADVGSWQ